MPLVKIGTMTVDRATEFGLPVLLVGFNRPKHFRAVLAEIVKARPATIYISLDGPRPGNDADRSARTQILRIVEEVTGTEEIRLRALDENIGSGPHVSSAISWMFEHEPFGAIIEDDCLPSPSFFDFVRTHGAHRPDEVHSIAGYSPLPADFHSDGSSYVSRFPITWGWATWRESWADYRLELGDWRDSLGADRFDRLAHGLPWFKNFWGHRFDELRGGSRKVWDYQWIHHVWRLGGRSLSPSVNLVRNIGFGADSTHTFFARPAYARPSRALPAEFWDEPPASPRAVDQAERYVHAHFYKVNRAWPVTATGRAVARPIVEMLRR